jgi:hypothetical protein
MVQPGAKTYDEMRKELKRKYPHKTETTRRKIYS